MEEQPSFTAEIRNKKASSNNILTASKVIARTTSSSSRNMALLTITKKSADMKLHTGLQKLSRKCRSLSRLTPLVMKFFTFTV